MDLCSAVLYKKATQLVIQTLTYCIPLKLWSHQQRKWQSFVGKFKNLDMRNRVIDQVVLTGLNFGENAEPREATVAC